MVFSLLLNCINYKVRESQDWNTYWSTNFSLHQLTPSKAKTWLKILEYGAQNAWTIFNTFFKKNLMCQNDAGKIVHWSFFVGFDLLAWTNLLILIVWQHLMLDFHWLFSCPIWHVWSQASNRKVKIGQFWCCLSQIKQSVRDTENQSDSRILLLAQLSEK